METDPRPWRTALRASHDRLDSLVRPLGADGARRQSYCSDWTVAQVMSHLGSGAVIFRNILDATVSGGDPPGRESFAPVWDEWNAKSPDDQVRDGLVADAALVEAFEGLSDEQLATLRFNLMGMEQDTTGFLRMRVGEHAVHTWDIAVALDPSATVGEEAVPLLVDAVSWVAERAGKPESPGRRLRVHTSDPTRDLLLATGGPVALGPWDGGTSDGELSLAAEALIRLVYGRVDTGPAGDRVTLDELRKVFPGV